MGQLNLAFVFMSTIFTILTEFLRINLIKS